MNGFVFVYKSSLDEAKVRHTVLSVGQIASKRETSIRKVSKAAGNGERR